MTRLQTERLILRNWEARDAKAFHRLNNDPEVMHFFPARRTREEADTMMTRWQGLYERDGYCFGAVEEKTSGLCVGLCGLARFPTGIEAGEIRLETGWRLLPEVWGHGYATEAAAAWLRLAFENLHEPGICAFAVPANRASIAVMKRIGMREHPNSPFIHPNVPDSHPHLKEHVLFALSREQCGVSATE